MICYPYDAPYGLVKARLPLYPISARSTCASYEVKKVSLLHRKRETRNRIFNRFRVFAGPESAIPIVGGIHLHGHAQRLRCPRG